MTLYYRSVDGTSRCRFKGLTERDAVLINIAKSMNWVRCSFWQFYFPKWFPIGSE